MFDVATFLMRWLFLSNLIREAPDVQVLPYNPQAAAPYDNGYYPQHPQMQQQMQPQSQQPPLSAASVVSCEDEWRDGCLRQLLSYPPGSQRMIVMDAYRAALVERLCDSLQEADETLEKMELAKRRKQSIIANAVADDETSSEKIKEDSEDEDASEEEGDSTTTESEESPPPKDETPDPEDVENAKQTIRVVRDYLPQLVSIVLKSPPAFDPGLVNPLEKLRRLILKRCVDDANWGVDTCWLLEAEVGRAWKSLFEHRQQTGRRLIVVLPAEKAAVLNKIGQGKAAAFDLLQDSEQATAFGYTIPLEESLVYRDPHQQQYYQQQNPTTPLRKKLPSSLSLRRCSHFGDTMHFIDKLTKISLELRGVPIVHRNAYLQESLREVNRRIRRRMVTRGDVSLDVEDHRGPDDWPQTNDVTSDMLMYSVHLPVDPKQNNCWPGGSQTSDEHNEGAVRILNIVVEESRVLASRERCPYLVRVEVADTNLRGNDSRLYASGARGLGATMEEALAMNVAATSDEITSEKSDQEDSGNYRIPSELFAPTPDDEEDTPQSLTTTIENKDLLLEDTNKPKQMPRGGWQEQETVYYSHNPQDVYATNPYDAVRENEFEQLHQQMHNEQGMMVPTPQQQMTNPIVSTGEALLDRVFGQALDEKCEEIRQASPYGKVEGWRLASFIMKAGEDIRREALVMQIITKLNDWFKTDIPEAYRPHMRPYTIMCVGGDAGIVECLSDAKSVDEVKKGTDGFQSLRQYFERAYGAPNTYNNNDGQYQQPGGSRTLSFEEAQDNFLRSLVGYSLICFILQIKDRHNANILMDREGNIIHIDFGFVLGDTPKMCKVPIFSEKAPFKLSDEYWEVLGGWNTNQGGLGVRFCHMFEHAFACAAAHTDEIAALVEATMLGLTQSPRQARLMANGVRNRLKMRGPAGSNEQKAFIMELVNAARTSMGTATYDWLQRNMNGYQ